MKKHVLLASIALSALVSGSAIAETELNKTVSAIESSATDIKSTAADVITVAKIKGLYIENTHLRALEIHVSVKDDIVTLSGKVNSTQEFQEAVMLASSVDNVKSVDASALHITNENPSIISDALITGMVKGKFIQNKLLDLKHVTYWDLSVSTENGIVKLSGTVPSEKEKLSAISITSGIDGVKGVNSKDLKIKETQE